MDLYVKMFLPFTSLLLILIAVRLTQLLDEIREIKQQLKGPRDE